MLASCLCILRVPLAGFHMSVTYEHDWSNEIDVASATALLKVLGGRYGNMA